MLIILFFKRVKVFVKLLMQTNNLNKQHRNRTFTSTSKTQHKSSVISDLKKS